MQIPDWYALGLISLAAWRVFQLLAFDSILERPRRYVTRLGKDWAEGQSIPKEYRERLVDWFECPYCMGFWIGLAWWGAWQIWPHGTEVVAVPFVISALVVGAHKVLSSE